MKNKPGFFLIVCGLSAVCLIILASSPLALLAFSNNDTAAAVGLPVHQESFPAESNYTLPNDAVDAYYLNENPEYLPAGNKPVYDVFTVTERQHQGLALGLPPVTPYYGTKVVYLTFDDGPDLENTPPILDILKKHNIKATFFVVGSQIEKHPEILRRIYQEGHAIGNHSYNHVYRELYQSANSYVSQLRHTDEIIKQVTGVRSRISRAPGGSAGSFTKEYWETLSRLGYVEIGWNISSGDASREKAGQIMRNIAFQMESKHLWSHAIVLMHDGRGHSETVKALPAIIKFYQDRHFEFRVVNFETPPPW